MTSTLTLDDLFQVAEKVERRGALFYRRAAEACSDAGGRKVLLNLAKMEGDHEHIFSAIRQVVSSGPRIPKVTPMAEAQFRVVFDVLLGGLERDLVERFSGKTSAASILREAVEFEKDTIVFLTQLSLMLGPDSPGREKFDAILREEVGHVFQLSAQLAGEKSSGRLSAFIEARA